VGRWRSRLAVFAWGFAVVQLALPVYVDGLPLNAVARGLALVAVAMVPSSLLLMISVLGFGLVQLPFRQTRGSGLALTTVSAAYLGGMAAAWVVFALRRGTLWVAP
jgi:hypothetical protein